MLCFARAAAECYLGCEAGVDDSTADDSGFRELQAVLLAGRSVLCFWGFRRRAFLLLQSSVGSSIDI